MAPTGDQARFLAVQEAYLLLSDPLRRRDWDSRHAPGPVRATERPVAPRREGPARRRRPRPRRLPDRTAAAPDRAAPPTGASGRDPGSGARPGPRRACPGGRTSAPTASGGAVGPRAAPTQGPSAGRGTRGPGAPPTAAAAGPGAGDIYSRSSGAAWSSAARRHFRKDDADLPRGGHSAIAAPRWSRAPRRARMLPQKRAARRPSPRRLSNPDASPHARPGRP